MSETYVPYSPDEKREMTGDAHALDAPDRRDGRVYVMPPELALAVQVALATGRPLLLRGDPGSGKSSLAPYVARQRGWRYYEHVVTSQTQARDLLWSFDAIRRLADAQAGIRDLPGAAYIEPGALWWAFSPISARRRGAIGQDTAPALEPFHQINGTRSRDRAVVLIDEIDKADPDMPNGLLVPLSSGSFAVPDINVEIRKEPPISEQFGGNARHLIVITTNEERELPEAFLRRCVVVWLESPNEDTLIEIAKVHAAMSGGEWTASDRVLAQEVARAVLVVREEARQQRIRPASTAEYLDALRACRHLGIDTSHEQWRLLSQFVLLKPQQPGGRDDSRHLAW